MTHRTNFTLSEANLTWLQQQATGERGLSRLVDSLIQKERTLGPIENRLQVLVRFAAPVDTPEAKT